VSQAERFLQLAGLELIRQEGLRVIKAPPAEEGEMFGSPFSGGYPWEEWDEVLGGDGPGVQPSIFAFRTERSFDEAAIRERYAVLVQRVASGQIFRGRQAGMPIRLVAIFCFNSVPAGMGRRLAKMVPDRYYSGLKPEVWIVDLSRGQMWAPRLLGILPTRAQRSARQALDETMRGGASVDQFDLARAEASAVSQRAAFVSTIRNNVPYVTYALLAAIWFVFLLESVYPPGSMSSTTLLHFGAMQPRLLRHGEWWLLLTEMFVHVGFVHILFNSVALYSVGTLVERIYGHLRYAIIYFASGLFASLASYAYMALTGQDTNIAAGASGAIFGIAGVVIVLGVLRESVVPRAVALQLSLFMGILIVMNLVFDAFSPEIDIRAHVAGLLMGIVLGYIMAPRSASTGGGLRSREMVG
jgi:rhomboid protease GluP